MLRVEDNGDPSGGYIETFTRSGLWTDRPSTKSGSRLRFNSKARGVLPPLQPLSIFRPKAEEWPEAGSDDLGFWPYSSTPGVRIEPVKLPGSSSANDKVACFESICSRVTDHIYIGSDAVAKNRELLRQNGITHVLNCVGFICPEYFKGDLNYRTLWLRDSPSEDITSILYDVFDYFEHVGEQGGRVLVHCCKGVSRSNSLVIAYLMWRDKQSFEDAFECVKAARPVTNPNIGFAGQLLLCQKRIHGLPASPSSFLRMYRMAPHSQYDPLHLVPKLISNPNVDSLDARGAFVVHVPTAIYVWVGKNCGLEMSDSARVAALQVIRYEKTQMSVCTIKEGEETSEFWKALGTVQESVVDDLDKAATKRQRYYSADIDKKSDSISQGVCMKNVNTYDLDFEIFHKALNGEFISPSAFTGIASEIRLPTRENQWGNLKWKFAVDDMKEPTALSKANYDTTRPSPEQDTHGRVDSSVCQADQSPVSRPGCNSPNSFSAFMPDNHVRMMDTCKEGETSDPHIDTLSQLSPPPCLPYTFSCSSSPLLSPSPSDYSNPFTISSSSSPSPSLNGSEFSYISAQPSPIKLKPSNPMSS